MDIDGDDTLVILTPWETRWLANALENNSKWQCAPPGIRVPKVVKFFNRFCSGYSAYSRVTYWRAKWFLQSAVRFGGCGSFVLDGAPWRGVRIRAAEAWSYASNSDMAHVSTRVGETTQFGTKKPLPRRPLRRVPVPRPADKHPAHPLAGRSTRLVGRGQS